MADKKTENGALSQTPAQFFRNLRLPSLDPMPKKRFINLATVNIRRINWIIALPCIVLIVFAAALIGKFAVVDRIALIGRERQELTQVQETLRAQERQLESYDVLRHRYAHYTTSGMTEVELARVDRSTVMEMILRVVTPHAKIQGWTLHENQLTLTVQTDTLQLVNDLAQHLLFEPMVEYCTVSAASTLAQGPDEEPGGVEATISAMIRTVRSGGTSHE